MRSVVFAIGCLACVSALEARPSAARKAALALRGGAIPPQKIAAGVNGAISEFGHSTSTSFFFSPCSGSSVGSSPFSAVLAYGSALTLDPGALAKHVMSSPNPPEFSDIGFAFGQYLGSAYLTQAALMASVLFCPAAGTQAHLLAGITLMQTLLCLTSLKRLFDGLEANSVTLTLPMGQGLMAALGLWGTLAARRG